MTNPTRVILIGGSAGVGKSTVARCVAHQLGHAHHLATGSVREILRTVLSREHHPTLFDYTFRPATDDQLIAHVTAQSALVCQAVRACIQRAYDEGTHLVVEGNHLLPALLSTVAVDAFVILRATEAQIRQRLYGNTHAQRALTTQDEDAILRTQEYLLAEAHRYRIPIIDNNLVEDTAMHIVQIGNLL